MRRRARRTAGLNTKYAKVFGFKYRCVHCQGVKSPRLTHLLLISQIWMIRKEKLGRWKKCWILSPKWVAAWPPGVLAVWNSPLQLRPLPPFITISAHPGAPQHVLCTPTPRHSLPEALQIATGCWTWHYRLLHGPWFWPVMSRVHVGFLTDILFPLSKSSVSNKNALINTPSKS